MAAPPPLTPAEASLLVALSKCEQESLNMGCEMEGAVSVFLSLYIYFLFFVNDNLDYFYYYFFCRFFPPE